MLALSLTAQPEAAGRLEVPANVVATVAFAGHRRGRVVPEPAEVDVRRDLEAAIAESIDAIDRVCDVVRALEEFSHRGRGRGRCSST